MGAAYMAAPHMDRRRDDPVRTEHLHQEADGQDIGDGVPGPHLMEVDLFHRAVMGMALRPGDQAVYGKDVLPDLSGNVHGLRHAADESHAGVGMMVMMPVLMVMMVFLFMVMPVIIFMVTVFLMAVVMITLMAVVRAVIMMVIMMVIMLFLMVVVMTMVMVLLFHSVHQDPHMGPRDPALLCLFRADRNALGHQAGQPLQKGLPLRLRQKLQKGRCQHISGGSHAAVQIQYLHPYLLYLLFSVLLYACPLFPASGRTSFMLPVR